MEEAAAVRRAAAETLRDVEPDELGGVIDETVGAESLVPGVVAVLAARTVDPNLEFPADRAAGVQLIYDGLRLTRDLAHDEPWTTGGSRTGDMAILAADVLVARGFYVLARTEAGGTAVEVVRSFGRDQTTRRRTDEPSLDRELEVDVLGLALVAGATASGDPAPEDAAAVARDLAADLGAGYPPVAAFVDDAVRETIDGLGGPARTAAE